MTESTIKLTLTTSCSSIILLEPKTDISPAITDFTPKKTILGTFASSHMGMRNLFEIFLKTDPMLYNDIARDLGTTLPMLYYLNFLFYGCGYLLK